MVDGSVVEVISFEADTDTFGLSIDLTEGNTEDHSEGVEYIWITRLGSCTHDS